LQYGEVMRVGAERPLTVDVRVLAATNKELSKEVAAGRFREDLYFRLEVFPVQVPSLNQRKDDIELLARSFVQAFCLENGLRDKKIDPGVFDVLHRRSWPGNVRELKNVVERAAILSSDIISVADLPEDPHQSPFDEDSEPVVKRPATPLPGPRVTLREYREAAERSYIVQTLVETEWNISRAAVQLGVERTNLHKKIRAYGIVRGEAP
jgi:transcriptional regulator with GAF, ATPase, and Fis domain